MGPAQGGPSSSARRLRRDSRRAAARPGRWRRPRASGRLLKPPEPSDEEKAVCEGLRLGAVGSSDPRRLRAYWLYRMLFGSDPLRERLTLFWHGHFATSLTKVDSGTALSAQVEKLRQQANGGFAGLLEAMIADAAMLVWLDGGTSRREQPNENFAREYLELFTLGTGAYTEQDIREAARALTGWVPEGNTRIPGDANPSFAFDDRGSRLRPQDIPGPDRHRGRRPTSCGSRSQCPEAARHLARKLYRAFVAEEPEPTRELIEPLAEALRSSDYSISARWT